MNLDQLLSRVTSWKFKFGIQQVKKGLELSPGPTIKVHMPLFSCMILLGNRPIKILKNSGLAKYISFYVLDR